jgi:hypothetical protein
LCGVKNNASPFFLEGSRAPECGHISSSVSLLRSPVVDIPSQVVRTTVF